MRKIIFVLVLLLGSLSIYLLISSKKLEKTNAKKLNILQKNNIQSTKMALIQKNSVKPDVENDKLKQVEESSSPIFKDEHGSKIELNTKNLKDAFQALDSRKTFEILNPAEEISNLREINFKNKDSMLFSGNFVHDKIVKFSLIYINESGSLSPISCVKIFDEIITNSDLSSLKMYDDENGVAAILIKDKYFIRMAYGFENQRFIVGEVYKKKNSWQLLKKFKANEVFESKSNGKCPYL